MLDLLQSFVDLGSSVVLPIIIFIFGLLLRVKPGKALTSGILVGIGFIGLNLVIGLLGESLGTAAQDMVIRFDLSLNTIDVGWPAAAAISYGTILGILAIPIGIIVNLVLLATKLSDTLNVDIWNFWHAAFIGSLVYAMTDNFALGVYAMIVYQAMIYFLGDLIAPKIGEYYGFENITFPHGTTAPAVAIAYPLKWLFDRIPGINKVKADPEAIQSKVGVLGETSVMGLLIGVLMGLLAGYDFQQITQLAMNTAAVMVLMPRMVSLLMEGLTPISDAASALVKERFPDREFYIGMDSALAVGDSAVLTSSLLLIPITLLLAFILPGNTTIPFGDFGTIPYAIALMVAVFGGNILYSVLGGTIYMSIILLITSYVAPLVTSAAQAANFDLSSFNLTTGQNITSMVEGGLWPTLLFLLASEHAPWVILTIILIVSLVGMYVMKSRRRQAA